MKHKLLLLSAFPVIVILLYAPVVQGVDIAFYSSDVIESWEVYDTVHVYDTPPETTTIDVYGSIIDLLTYDSSTVDLFGDGTSSSAWVDGAISLYDSSTLNFRGGVWTADIGYLVAYNSSTVNVYDGIVGLVSMANFEITDTSTANIYGGSGAAPYVSYGFSTINIYDGGVGALGVLDSSTANIYGGNIGERWGFGVHPSAVANIYGYDFNYDPQARWDYMDDPADGWWVSRLTGDGLYGTPISIWDIPDPYTTANINLIPEPASIILLGLGGLFVRRHRTKR